MNRTPTDIAGPSRPAARRPVRHNGTAIRSLREAVWDSQEEFAQYVGLTQSHMSRIENEDIRRPKISTLRKISAALGVPLAAILRDQDEDDVIAA